MGCKISHFLCCIGSSPALAKSAPNSALGSRSDTPTLSDLEMIKQKLEKELETEAGDSQDAAPTPVDSSSPHPPPTPDKPPLPQDTPPVTPQTSGTDGVFKTPHGITPVSDLAMKATSVPQSETGSEIEGEASPTVATNQIDEDVSDIKSPVDANASIEEAELQLGDVSNTSNQSTPSSIPLNRTTSMSLSFGTPVLEGVTPIDGKNLPSADKFADGITEHIPFENLPNTTGRFAEVRRLIDSARKTRLRSDSE